MGFSHMWYTQKIIDEKKFNLVTNDFLKLLPIFEELNIPIMGPNGIGNPIIDKNQIALNGKTHCNHNRQDIFNAWPINNAKGIHNLKNNEIYKKYVVGISTMISTRTCNGDCSYEPLIINRIHSKLSHTSIDKNSLNDLQCFSSCKTGFRPYDIVVMAVLSIAKYHLQDLIRIKSDGKFEYWQDVIILLEHFLHYDHSIFNMIKNDLL